ncbi:hypothetical protein [Clostridium gasigenes]|uniref:hypothetical protein n=1 Tax=Clostridium gasigenes TaxID=94869 RepID=UPI001C0B6F0D|nr:hypothetical protein [Clostridium gasigenes]MBU3104260.1 hypothetical protein [Clostridium gasigenes]
MNLIKAYEEYTRVNNDYVNFIEGLVNSDLGDCNETQIKDHLLCAQNSFESIKIRIDVEKVEEKDQENLRDLKYLVMDALFISADLVAFYKYKQPERFKMRAVNYINKKRRAEMFKDNHDGSCRV